MTKLKIIGVVMMALLGVGLAAGGIFTNQYINNQVESGVQDSLVIENTDDDGYEDWKTNADEDDVPKYKKYYFWNLTNPEGYLQGDAPVYVEVGPYVYRQYDVKIDVQFNDDEVSYQTYTYYEFQPSMSVGPETDTFTNINPAYQGVLANAGSENALATGFVGPTLATITNTLKQDFVPQVQTSAVVDVMNGIQQEVVNQFYAVVNASTTVNAINQTIEGVTGSVGLDQAFADYFNSTTFHNTYGVELFGISEYWVASTPAVNNLNISATAQDLLINGSTAAATALSTPELELGWMGDLDLGTGLLAFLQAYQAVGDPATFGSFYAMNSTQMQGVIHYMTSYMFDQFVPAYYSPATPLQVAEANFYTQWANGTVYPDPNGIDLDDNETTTLYGLEAGVPTATDLNMSQTMDLFDASNQFSFLNDTGVHLWYNASYLDDATYIGAIMSTFGLNATQWGLLDSWFQDFRETIVPPFLLDEFSAFGLTTMDDFALLHWGHPVVTGGSSLLDLDTSLSGYPELWAFAANSEVPDVTISNITLLKSLLSLDGFFNSNNVGALLLMVQGSQFTTIQSMFGLNQTEATSVAGYFEYLKSTFVSDTLEPFFADGGGLLTTRSVSQWLWDVNDPFLSFLLAQGQVSDASANLFTNHTGPGDDAIAPASTINTGRNDISQLNQYINWHGMTEISGVWESSETITGTDATQFAPGVTSEDNLTAFVSDLLRVVDFEFDSNQELHLIDLLRFKLSSDTLAPNANYHQSIAGIANMTAANNGVPIFLSKPHFLDSTLTNALGSTDADVSAHDTFIDVEPNTGAVMNAKKRLQLNIFTQTAPLDYFNSEVSSDEYMPIVWIEEGGTLPEEQADSFRDSVYSNQNLATASLYGGPVIGAVLVLSSVMIAVQARKP